MTIPERTQASKNGLIEMCNYLSTVIDLKENILFEIGSYTGVSTEIFCQRFKKVVVIDPWISGIGEINDRVDMQEVYTRFVDRMCKYENLTVLKHYAQDVIDNFDEGSIDVLYIDASHMYENVKRDLLWKSKVREGGFVTGHDYWPGKFEGVIHAVNEVFGKPDKVFSDTSWIVRV
jgi:predicted O-methyltransferase YrrM